MSGSESESESESELFYDLPFTSNQFVLAKSPFRLTTSNLIFQLNTCGYSLYVTSSLTRGWVWRLQLLLVLASAVVLRSESRGIYDHILLSQIQDSPNLGGQVPAFISLHEQGGPVITPGTGFPLRRLLRLAGLQWSYSTPPPHGVFCSSWLGRPNCFPYKPLLHGPSVKHKFQQYLSCCMRIRCRGNVFADSLLRNKLHNTVFHSPISRSFHSDCTRCTWFTS
jgi:hypothetical protein